MADNRLFRVTKTKHDPSWYDKPVVKYGGIQTAIQTYVSREWCGNDYDVKVELVKVVPLGEIDMEKYKNRNKIETYIK